MKSWCILVVLIAVAAIEGRPHREQGQHHHNQGAGGTSFEPANPHNQDQGGTSWTGGNTGHGHGQTGTSFEPVDPNQHTSHAQRG